MNEPGQPWPQQPADDAAADTDDAAEKLPAGQQAGDDDQQEAAVDAFAAEHEDDAPAGQDEPATEPGQ